MWESATSPLQPGDPVALGPYRVASRLGSGGMGTVYLAQAPDGNPVAVKVIRPELAQDASFRARFAAEIDAARRVTASCTARVLDADLRTARPWFATEYVGGTPLDRLVATSGPLPPSSLEGLAVGVATALTAIHAAGLVHRDLKPANVLVSPFGPKVIDFGIARAADATGSLTMTGMVLGTPGWMAPEQLAGLPATPASDVFSWGCLVAFAASGQAPFGEGAPEVVAQRVAWQPPDLGGVPEPLHSLVAAATNREPARRPAARELLLALLGDQAPPDPHAAVTQGLQRTWIAPRPAWGEPPSPSPSPSPSPLPAAGPGAALPRRWYRKKRYLLPLTAAAVLLAAGLNGAGGKGGPASSGRVSGGTPSASTRSSGTGSGSQPGPGTGQDVTATQGQTVRDGKLEFKVTSVSCGHATIGRSPLVFRPQGQFCFVRLQARNVSARPWGLPLSQYLDDTAGNRHGIDVRARLALPKDRLWGVIDPGDRVSGTLVFDLPESVRPDRVTLHDSLFSRGVTVQLRRS